MMSMMSEIIDTHSHYDDSAFDADRDVLLPEILKSVRAVVHAATDEKSSLFGIKMSGEYANFYTSVGFHPESMDALPQDPYETVINLTRRSKKVVAVGEIGLDYHYEGYDRGKQLDLFVSQLEAAKDTGLPVIIHCRDATEDMLKILDGYRPRGVMHCFSGSAETAAELIKMGLFISFTGALTFKNAKKALKACEAVPLDRLLLETDCPYMAPEPMRGKRCDSRMIIHTAQVMAQLKGVSTEEMIKTAAENSLRLFGFNHAADDVKTQNDDK